MSRPLAIAAALTTFVFFGCGLFPDLTHLSGGDGSVDGGGGSDGSGPAPAEAGPVSPCSAKHDFCDDFDSSATPEAKWTSQQVDREGAISLAPTAVSAPRAVQMRMDRRNNGAQDAYAILRKSFPGWRPFVVEYDMYLKRPEWHSADVNSGFFHADFVGTSPTTRDVTISIGEDYKSIGGSVQTQGRGPIPTNTWVHFRMAIDPVRGRIDARIGDDEISGTWQPFEMPSNASTLVSIGILGYNEPAPSFEVLYDNVTVDFTSP